LTNTYSLAGVNSFCNLKLYAFLQEVRHHLLDILHPSEGMFFEGPADVYEAL
jgi:hypothetical protein